MVKPTLTTSQQTVEQIEAIQVVVWTKVSKISESGRNKKKRFITILSKKMILQKGKWIRKKEIWTHHSFCCCHPPISHWLMDSLLK